MMRKISTSQKFDSSRFLLFINDLLKLPTVSRSFVYADDTVFVTSDVDVKALESNCNHLTVAFHHNVFLCVYIIPSNGENVSTITELLHICYDNPIVCPLQMQGMNYRENIFTHRH